MKGKKMTEYTFEIKGKVKVTVNGMDTEENYQKALQEAVDKAKKEIDQDWVLMDDVDEYTDYENGD